MSLLLISQALLPTIVQAVELESSENISETEGLMEENVTDVISSYERELPIATITSDWSGTVFGDVGGQDKIVRENFEITENMDGTVKVKSANNRGKISGSTDGIAYYFQEIPSDADFEFHATAYVESFDANNQVSFGIMLRDEVYDYVNGTEYASGNHLSVGALDQTMKAFKREDGSLNKIHTFAGGSHSPNSGQIFDLSVKKMGSLFVLQVNGEEKIIEDYTGAVQYAGLFTSRNTEIVYSNLVLNVQESDESRYITELEVDSSEVKTTYLVNEELDLSALEVAAHYSDGTTEVVAAGDYLVTGFDSSVAGTNTIKIHYGGISKELNLNIEALMVTDLRIVYLPARTEYYLGDSFEEKGLIVEAEYNNGEIARLSREQYDIEVASLLEVPGEQIVTVISKETPTETAHFTIHVNETELVQIEITKKPQKERYFLGETLDLDGMVVYAHYQDGNALRLMRNEYTVAELDTTTPGIKNLTVTHKGMEASFELLVKEKEFIGIAVQDYPKTTYTVGEVFIPDGLTVVKQYDNGDTELVSEEEYQLVVPSFSEAGTYRIEIQPSDPSVTPITLPVTIIDEVSYEWHALRFGQSTSNEKNTVTVNEDGTVDIVALEGGGKVTGDHDGISFYYTEIDAAEDNFEISATIEVTEYAKNPHDGQESFGIMARDVIGNANDSSVFASNIAAIGGYSGGTRESNGIQLFTRTGVESFDGAGSQGIHSVMLDEHRPLGTYRLTLKKTNSGFIGSVNNGTEEMIFEPEILNVQDSKMYIGFYTARLATIQVSDIDFTVTKMSTDAPKVDPPAIAIEPGFTFTSLQRTSVEDYELRLKANVDGILTVKQGQETIASDIEIQAGEEPAFATTLTDDYTNFSVTFLPDDTQFLTSYEKIVKNFTVEKRTYEGDIIVSPEGGANGSGTIEDPLDIDTAIDFVNPGQKIIVQDGVYLRNAPLEIKKYNDGTEEAMKYLFAAKGANPVFDFDQKTEGGILSGDYWHIKGIDFRRSAGNTKGFVIGGSHNIIELAQFYENGDTGLQISRTDNSTNIEDWPSYNLMLNVTSFDNRDPSDNNADGFAAKLTSGVGNIFRGAIAYNNIDDGWDLYTKSGSGEIGAVLIEDSIAFNNGFVSYEYDGRGDGNGFKLGGEGIHVEHTIRNSYAFGNLAYGFTSNSNPGVIAENNIGFNNGSGNISFTTYPHIPTDFTIDGFVSYQKDFTAKDNYPADLEAVNNYFFDGEVSRNSSGVQLSDENFESLEFVPYERDEEGNIVWGTFLSFIPPVTDEPEEPENPEEEENPEEGERPGGSEDPEGSDPIEEDEAGQPTDSTEQLDETNSEETNEITDKNTAKEQDNQMEESKNEKLPYAGLAQSPLKAIGLAFLVIGLGTLFFTKKRKAQE